MSSWLGLAMLILLAGRGVPAPVYPNGGTADISRGSSFGVPAPASPCTDTEPLPWLKCAVRLGVDECLGRRLPPPGSDQPLHEAGRAITNGILGALLTVEDEAEAVEIAAGWIAASGPGTTFNGQSWPAVWYKFGSRFNATTKATLHAKIVALAPSWNQNVTHTSTQAAAGDVGTDVSYNNMYYMNMVNAILFGEIAEDAAATAMGYRLLDNWLAYTKTVGGLHEFSSPTYYWVQINALYMGFLYAKAPGARETFGQILDHTWADVAASYFAPTQTISGPHSRDYDFLFGHGALQVHLFAQGLPGMTGPICEINDTHCERSDDEQNVFALLNLMEGAGGYTLPAPVRALATAPIREISGRYIGMDVTANGNSARWAHRYNYVRNDAYALGSASQDYITNTHSKYFPGPQDKLFDLEVGPRGMSMLRPVPAVTLVPDYLDAPYGHIHEPTTDKPSHLALHPGMVQHKNVLLASIAINVMDTLDGFVLNSSAGKAGDRWHSVSTSVVLPLAAGRIWHQPVSAAETASWIQLSATVPIAVPLKIGDAIALSVGKGAFAIRVVTLDKTAGSGKRPAAELLVKSDAGGLKLGAVRLVGYHSDVGQVYTPDPRDLALRFACLIKAVEVPSDDAAEATVKALAAELTAAPVTSTVAPGGGGGDAAVAAAAAALAAVGTTSEWSLRTTLHADDGPVSLEVSRNLTCSGGGSRSQTVHTSWNCLLARKINGSDMVVPDTLLINGKPAPALPVSRAAAGAVGRG